MRENASENVWMPSVCVGNFSLEFDDFLGCVLCYCLPSFCILSTAAAAAAAAPKCVHKIM